MDVMINLSDVMCVCVCVRAPACDTLAAQYLYPF